MEMPSGTGMPNGMGMPFLLAHDRQGYPPSRRKETRRRRAPTASRRQVLPETV